jgi:hypothetical protein
VPPVVLAETETLFRALAQALEAREDGRAAALVARMRRGPLGPAEERRLESAERVLAGRALVRGLELALVSEPLEGLEGRFALRLEARSSAPQELYLCLPPADLKHLTVRMNVLGVEGLEFESKASGALEDLRLPPGLVVRSELFSYELPLGRALGVRERWRLEPRAGEIECDGRRYPAQDLRVRGCERERVSPLVASEPAEPAALAEALVAVPTPPARALLELALRTPPERRGEALRALAPVVARLAGEAPERIQAAEPALRWMTGNRELGPDAHGWARYLAARAGDGSDEPGEPRDTLDLPERSGPPRSDRPVREAQ